MRNFRKNLLLLAAAFGFAVPVRAGSMERGVIHFYEPKTWKHPLTNWQDSEVKGGEAIFWWGDLEKEEGVYDWSPVDRELQVWSRVGKKLDIRLATAHNSPFNTPTWLFDKYPVRLIGRGYWADFESNLGDYVLEPQVRRTDNPDSVVAGRFSLTATNVTGQDLAICKLNPSCRLESSAEYSVGLDYRATIGMKGWVEATSEQAHLTNRSEFKVETTQTGCQTLRLKLPPSNDCCIRFGCKGRGTFALDNLNVIRLDAEPIKHNTDFENPIVEWELLQGAQLTTVPAQVISGSTSLLLSSDSRTTALIRNREPIFALDEGQGYAFGFDFKGIKEGQVNCRIFSTEEPDNPLNEQTLIFQAGQTGHQKFYFPTFIWKKHCRVELTLQGNASLVIDNLDWARWSDRVTCFPDYFSTIFQAKWTRFVKAFAQRYGGNADVGTVSVGGFGRWEEVILDDDAYGGLDAQWLARGYTPEKYLAHITDCLELYHSLLPQKKLRVCLAYGLYNCNPRDWLYRRVAQAAVARGIGLKQNGWSEKWDMWDANTSASYLWNRYRFNPEINLTLETGGQIVHPGPGQGHPISFLNRGMIDGTEVLSLYGNDLTARKVHEYLRFANEQLGHSLVTTLYCRLGDTSQIHEFSSQPLKYTNLWLGLRQFQESGAEVIYTNRRGELCAATSEKNPRIVFDVDDRQQYNGMFGVVLMVKYLDEGNDSFTLRVFNQATKTWFILGTIHKTGSGTWKTAAFENSQWCGSGRDSGEDTHNDIEINDNGDGIEFIASVELHYVPAREWKRDTFVQKEPSTNHLVVTDALSQIIEIPVGQSISGIAVPLWTGNLEFNSLRGRIYAQRAGGETLLCEKQYTLPADGDWFEMPFVQEPGCLCYRVELGNPVGSVGWYLSTNKTLAYHAWGYAGQLSNTITFPPASNLFSNGTLVNFESRDPFFGLRVEVVLRNSQEDIIISLRRRLPGSALSPTLCRQTVRFQQGQPALIHFEPQTAGEYQIEFSPTNLSNAKAAGMEIASVTPDCLLRRQPAAETYPFDSAEDVVLFQPSVKNQGVTFDPGVKNLGSDRDSLELRVLSPSAGIAITPPSALLAKPDQKLSVRLRNHSSAAFARVYWSRRGTDFTPENSALIPLVQNDDEMREYYCSLGLYKGWQGEIARWRIIPMDTLETSGSVNLGKVGILNTATVKQPDPSRGFP